MPPRKRRFAEKFRSLYLWHRYAGLGTALLAAWLAITGLLLNHTDDLDLAGTFVHRKWLLSLYGLEAGNQLEGHRIGDRWVTQAGDRVYLDNEFIAAGNLAGAAVTSFGFVVAFENRLELYTHDGTLVEALPFTTSSAPIAGIAVYEDGVLVSAGDQQFKSDAHLSHFSRIDTPFTMPKANALRLPPDLAHEVATDALQHTLTWERVLLDLHAGRLFGKAGYWLADAAGILLLLLAVTGIIVWVQRAFARRRHR